MKIRYFLMLVALFIATGLYARPGALNQAATQPSDNRTKLEVRAQEEFNRANWGSALPLLKQVAKQMRDDGDTQRLGSIEESIRVCEKNLAATTGAKPGAAQNSNENRKAHPAPKSGEVLEMDIKDLGNFDYNADDGGNIPDDVKALNGVKFHLKGFMIPMDQADAITQFALVPSLFSCCFGQPPQVQHTIVVHTTKDHAVQYSPDEIVVEGTLTVDEKKEDGFIVSIFEMECTSVKPAAK